MTRKLVTLRIISEIKPIEGADKICAYRVDGWWVIDQVGKYKVGDEVLFAEVDSWIPHELAPFLSKGKEPREYKGIRGEKLKSIKMKGQISQGLLLNISELEEKFSIYFDEFDKDYSEVLNVIKWEPPEDRIRAANAKGNFPSFIPKTDQERVQNCSRLLEKRANEFAGYEVTEKLEGSSMTVYFIDETYGVCSRNLELKEDDEGTFWSTAKKYELIEKLKNINSNLGFKFALQGELVGPGIQGNIYGLDEFKYYVYDIFDIEKQQYLRPEQRNAICAHYDIEQVPYMNIVNLYPLVNFSVNGLIEELINIADGKSSLAPVLREGIVFKSITDPEESFKVISNQYLLKGK